jgi:hypothetical protein
MLAARLVFVWVACSACKGNTVDPNKCVPSGPYDIPPDCDDADCEDIVCDTTCPTGQVCPLLDCKGSPQCRLDCQGSATCTYVDCDQSDVCFIDCHETGSTCEVSCVGAQECGLDCYDGAECLLECGSATGSACAVEVCSGGSGMLDCGSGVFACNRPCP